MTSLAGIVLSLALLMTLAYRGVSVLVLAPLCALLAALASPEAPLMASYTQVFMRALGGFVIAFFPLFLLGAVFGRLMQASGAAGAIAGAIVRTLGARHAVLAIVGACAVLTYGGVSLFVVAFAVYPIAAALFRAAQVPKRLVPATIALGAFTFTMTALPGTPAIQNAIPMPYFGTTPFAAPGLGLVGGALMAALGAWWLRWRVAAAQRAGEGYGAESDGSEGGDGGEGGAVAATGPADGRAAAADAASGTPAMPLAWALAPIVLVVALNYALAAWFWPAVDTRYLAEARFGETTLGAVRGLWSVIGALGAATVLLLALWWRASRRGGAAAPALKAALEEGAGASVMPLMNTASQVGYGAVIASLAGFALVREALLGLAPGNPLVSMAIAVNVLAGITGSASGGMSIALQALGGTWLEMGRAAGIAPDLLHRVTAIATGGLDALPHNGAVITLLGICGLTHRRSYFDIFVVAVLVPLVSLAVVVVLGTAFGSF